MLIKGEKWACEACVRGHRVSNCQHSDRPLQHINKKGRPVSQCQHCRTLRKSRSAHVRCDCGEKAHLPKGACGHDSEPQEMSCGCCHGQRCTCSIKKEHLDPVPESDSDDTPAFSIPVNEKRPRARAHTVQSDSSGLTVFTNGHHKPGHKHNNAAHKCGLPYVVPRANTIHGTLASGLANRSVDSLPHTSTIDTLHSTSHIKDSMVSAQQEQRMIKSENGSPVLATGANMEFGADLAPLDMSNVTGDYGFIGSLDGFSGIPDLDQPLFSAGLSAGSIDWSHYDGLDFNNDTFANPSYSQAASFTGFDFGANEHPALTTTSTSGEISEVEDFASRSDFVARPRLQQRRPNSDFDASDVGDGYRLSTASSYIGLSQAQILSSSNIDNVDIDAFLNAAQTKSSVVNSEASAYTAFNDTSNTKNMFDDSTNFSCLPTDDDNDAFWMSGFTSGQMNNGRNDIHDSNNWLQ